MEHDSEYWEQGLRKIDSYVGAVKKIVGTLPDGRRQQVQSMLDGPIGERFFEAPASTKKIYHYAFPGGLVAHSLNVVKNAVVMANGLAPGRWPTWKVMFCALFHDFGKAGDGERPYYVITKSKWKSERGEYYELNPEMQFMPSSEMGLYVMQREGIVLEADEYLAIRLNDGPAADGNADYAFREPDLAVLINMADNWSMRQEKAELK